MAKRKNRLNKLEFILSVLSKYEHTQDEEDRVVSAFIDKKLFKIDANKILNKLKYIRINDRMRDWEDRLEVSFNNSSEMEFYHSYKFEFLDTTFHKSLLTTTEAIDTEILLDENILKIKRELLELKESAIKAKREEIEEFLKNIIHKPHRYLKLDDMVELISKMPPEDRLYEIEIPLNILEKIIPSEYKIVLNREKIDIYRERNYTLFSRELSYNVVQSYNRKKFYSLIWREKDISLESIDSIEVENNFKRDIDELKSELYQLSRGLNIDNSILESSILNYVERYIDTTGNLKLTDKVKRRVIYHFLDYIAPIQERKRKEELLAKSIRDFKSLYPLARELKREIIFHVGTTNSGKTYQALKELKDAETGYYLAPLRLLALEGYEKLKDEGVNVSLITGEEEIIDEDSTHISSTIEMMNSSVEVDIAVIDEIQMIDDRDRGWAWANALIGVPAKKVILTGSPNAVSAVEKLCEYLNEPLRVVNFERKNKLKVLSTPTDIDGIEKGTAIIAFSRRDVLALKHQLSKKYRVSVVYGNLSPEVRREEARRFREGESDILVATDAISMGLNLPIKTLIFSKDEKFDGLRRRELYPIEVHQISGRAGRYGFEEVGYIGALDRYSLKSIKSKLNSRLKQIELPFSVMATLEHIILIGEILETNNLSTILNFFADNMEFEGPFIAGNIDSLLEIAEIVDNYEFDLKTKYYLSSAPAPISSPYIEAVFHRYIRELEQDKQVRYIPPNRLPKFAQTNEMMLEAEDRVREISLYLWLSFKFPEHFKDTKKAIEAREKLNRFIEESLKQGSFVKKCNRCGKVLDFTYRFSICEKCYIKSRRRFY